MSRLPFRTDAVPSLFSCYLDYASAIGKYTADAFRIRRDTLEDFAAFVGSRSITPALVEIWMHSHTSWRSPATIRTRFGYVRAAFNWCVRERLIESNPVIGTELPPLNEPRPPLSDWQFHSILRRSTRSLREILAFCRWVGCRPGEARSLEWHDVRLDSGMVRITNHKTLRRTGVTHRDVPLVVPAVSLLIALRRRHNEHNRVRSDLGLDAAIERVFLNSNGDPWTKDALSRAFRTARERAGISARERIVFYGLRHSFGTRMAGQTELGMLASLMGHTRVNTVLEHYVDLGRQYDLKRAAMGAVRTRLE